LFLTYTKNWLEHSCVVFSQYYDTVKAAEGITSVLPDEPVAIYAG